ncbi:MAG: serpin family protein [Desulfotomaculaceae bacterium]|nr:serpin family protein [Desulfotomaculaceae bacterium]
MKGLIGFIMVVCMLYTGIAYADNGIIDSTVDENEFKYSIGDSDILIPSAENKADILNQIGLFKGRYNGYELDKPVSRAEAITMVLRMIGEENEVVLSSGRREFSDVEPSHWAMTNIGYAAHKGYINGTSEITFEPERGVTGREFVKMLLSGMGYQGITIEDAYEAGIKYALLDNNYTKLAVSTDGYQLIRNDVVNICYSSLLVKTAEGKFLKDLLIEKEIVKKQDLNKLILCVDITAPEMRGFAWNLNNLMPKDKNYMFSPLSVKMALAMAAVGADGETKEEILKTLRIEDLNKFNALSAQLIKEYSENEDVKLNIANSLWLNTDYYKDVDFEDIFKNAVSNYYDADSEKVNNENAVETVNNWVKNKTNNKITELIADSDFLAYIVNAIYFKGEWMAPFQEGATQKAEFIDRSGKKADIDFMNMTGYFDYYEDDNAQIVRLPYKDKKTSMYIAIPAVREMDLDKNIDKMELRRVQISMPKFKTEFSVELNDTLSQMGIQTAFNPNKADFKNMFTDTPDNIFISNVIHKTFISVDENGTEAAAVTGVGSRGASAPIEPPIVFNANKPFTYFIHDDINEEILFMGEYAYVK